jgi:soluble lytic murein transglycosylase
MVLLLTLLSTAVARDAAGDAELRFALAHDAYRAGERVRLARISESLSGHPLSPWLDYWQLRLRLEEDSTVGVAEFLERESGSYLAEKLRAEWLRYLGKHRDWEDFQREYPSLVFPDQEVVCFGFQARLERQQDVTALDEARPLWFSVVDLPESCLPPMERLIAEKRINVDDVWARIRRLAELKKASAAKSLVRYLPAGSAPELRAIDAAIDNPARYLA